MLASMAIQQNCGMPSGEAAAKILTKCPNFGLFFGLFFGLLVGLLVGLWGSPFSFFGGWLLGLWNTQNTTKIGVFEANFEAKFEANFEAKPEKNPHPKNPFA